MNKKRNIILLAFTFILIIAGAFFVSKRIYEQKNNNNLINISDLSEEFINNYIDEYKKIKNEDKDNLLIVTSKENIKETYGAVNIIETPNYQYILQYSNEEDKNNALIKFNDDNSIISAEENGFYTIEETDYNSWGVEAMAMDYVKENIIPDNLNEVTVAIIDTGLDLDLANKYYSEKIAGIYNVLDGSTTKISDENGHGTHIFGTIAESTPSNVKILPIKVSSDGNIYYTDIKLAMEYIIINEKADVINMSFGGYGYNQALETLIESAKQKNIISVAAAGNDNTSSNHYPSALDNTISIASVDSNLNKSTFSNYGNQIDFTAPGTSIKSIMSSSATISKNNGNADGDDDHETISGTSMATPHAASAVAILKSFNKNLTLEETVELLQSRSIDLGSVGWDKYFGYGLVSFSNAEFCDGTNCDEYNVFKSSEENKVEIVEIGPKESNNYIVTYNYGNITNLMNHTIRLYYNNDFFIEKKLSDLDGVVIENYDPNIKYNEQTMEGSQTVTINYAGFSTIINVKNYFSANQTIWKYESVDDNSVKIVGHNLTMSNSLPNIIYFPEVIEGYNVVEIGDTTFKGEKNLRKVVLSKTIKKIGEETFANCSALDTVDLSINLESIGASAFKNTNLEEIIFPESLLKIGSNAFENSKITSIIIPKNVNEIGDFAFAGCNNVEQIVVDSNNSKYDSRNTANAIIETATNTIIKGNYNTRISNTVEKIGTGAFYSDNKLWKITIPSCIKEIGDFAFRYDENLVVSSLEEVLIPRSVTKIGLGIFNQKDKNVIISTYSDATARVYAIQNKISYRTMDYNDISSSLIPYRYNAFDKISGKLLVVAYYDIGYYSNNTYYSEQLEQDRIFYDDVSKITSSNLEINYIDDRDSLRFGDTYIIVKGKDKYNSDFESQCMVQVSKINPNYTVPTNLKANIGQKLSDIELPDNFEWMNPEEVINESGDVIFEAKYIPDDTLNYNIVENIIINVYVNKPKEIIEPNIVINNKIYDGTLEISSDNIIISNLQKSEYSIESISLSDFNVGDRTATIKIRLTDEKFKNYTFEGEKQEKEFIVNFKIIPLQLEKPTLKELNYIYNGLEQIVLLNNYQEDKMHIIGNKRTNAGEQDVIISLKNNNYIWSDNSSSDVVLKFKINKADPEYNLPTGLTADIGNKLSDITLPDNYEWMNSNEIIEESGNVVFKAKYIPQDTVNYKTVENIEITINVAPKIYIVTYNSNDGKNTTSTQEIEPNKKTMLNQNVFERDGYKFKSWNTKADGTGIFYSNKQEIILTKNLILYAIWEESYSYVINKYTIDESNKHIDLIDINTSVDEFKKNIEVNNGYTVEVDYKSVNGKNLLYTGGKTKIYKNNKLYVEYINIIRGDVNGNATIDIIDYIRIMKDIMDTGKLTGVYIKAADVNQNEKIDIIDYIRIMKMIMEEN